MLIMLIICETWQGNTIVCDWQSEVHSNSDQGSSDVGLHFKCCTLHRGSCERLQCVFEIPTWPYTFLMRSSSRLIVAPAQHHMPVCSISRRRRGAESIFDMMLLKLAGVKYRLTEIIVCSCCLQADSEHAKSGRFAMQMGAIISKQLSAPLRLRSTMASLSTVENSSGDLL